MNIQEDIVAKLIAHAYEAAPVECCGYLAGTEGVITQHYPLTNIDQSPEHFSFDPKEQFAAVKQARSAQLEMLAVYHSHPASPARPSQEDINLAYDPQLSYVIVSLLTSPAEVKSFKIVDAQVTPEPLEVIV